MRHSFIRNFISFTILIALCVSCAPAPVTVVSPAATLTAPDGNIKTPLPQPTQTLPADSVTSMPVNSDFNCILGRPTANSITLSIYSLSDAQVSIYYGTASGSYNAQTEMIQIKASVPQNVELTGLTADTAYYYQLISDNLKMGEHIFHTQRVEGSTFRFTIDADPHNRDPRFNGSLYALTLNNALAEHPDFHIDLGDTFMTEKLKVQAYTEVETTFVDMRPYFGIIGADAPLFLVNGNHEGELGWLLKGQDKDLPLWTTQLRQAYYPNPLPGGFYFGATATDPALGAARDGYYAWTWGDALFVVLDPFWYTASKPRPDDLNNNWTWTLGREQYNWLKSTLETSQASYKFIFTHHLVGGSNKDARGGVEAAPYFEWGGKNADGTYGFDQQRPGWGVPIHQLLVENHVSAVFHGHDHVFVKQDLDGIVYQELPQPSNAEYNKSSLAAEYGYLSGDVLGSSGHLLVTVGQGQATVQYVRAYLPENEKGDQRNGQIDYTYTIAPR